MVKTLNLESVDTYQTSSIDYLKNKLNSNYGDAKEINIERIKEDIDSINAYPNIEELKPLDTSQVVVLDEDKIDISEAERTILNGEFFWEHAAAGEATRLGLGTKYLLDFSTFTKDEIIELVKKEAIKDRCLEKLNLDEIKENLVEPSKLLPISFGVRHMLQQVYDLIRLAKKYHLDPQEVINRQKSLVILNKGTSHKIIEEFKQYDFFGLREENVFFMVQENFHGISLCKEGNPFYNTEYDNKRLHNHGQMMMQKVHNNSIFHFKEGKKESLSYQDYVNILKGCKDLLSYNIEDISYLNMAVDYHSLALSLNLGKEGYNMVMEIVGQNPLKPQKGGAAFYDPLTNKNVMIENDMLKDLPIENITYLNRNFNHYPNPAESMKILKDRGLPMQFTIKKEEGGDYIYFCSPQGNLNFLVKTAFIIRKNLKPIQNLKSAATIKPTLKAMLDQDQQPGFKELAQKVGVLK